MTSAPPNADEAESAETAMDDHKSSVVTRGSFPVHTAICAALAVAAAVVLRGLLASPVTGALALNAPDQALFEWMLALGPRFWAGDLDLVTKLLNAPDGVNLLANSSVLAIGIFLAPVTATAGASVTFVLAAFLNLAGTAIAFYLLFARGLRLHPAGAAIGAALCAYGPGTISQANSHLHMTSQWLVPVIVWLVIRLARTKVRDIRRIVVTGTLLGLTVSVQLFVGEETLFLTALTLALFCVGYAIASPARAWAMAGPLAAGLAVGASIALVLLAYPLWVQFAGPQHVPNGPFSQAYFGADLASFTAYSPLSVGGSPANERLASGAAEYNSFFGLPLLLVVLVAAEWLWRRPAVVASIFAGIALFTLSLGTQLIIDTERTAIEPPLSWFSAVPVIDNALPTRFALPLLPLFGFVVACAVDRAVRTDSRLVRTIVLTLVVISLLPIVPKPLPTLDRQPVPRFFTSGHWRSCVKPGETLVPVPLPTPGVPEPMRWAAAADDAFALPEGFFIAPYAEGGRASVGTYSQPTSQLFSGVERTGTVPPIGDAERAAARQDISFWRATCFVLAPDRVFNPTQLRSTMEQLIGPGEQVDDVIVWRVRPGSTP